MDPSQIDQILVNLYVNARDAVSDTGKILIETSTATIDHAHFAEHADAVPGDFVLLAVNDNGCGMDRQILDNLFEPFFTTKGLGEAAVALQQAMQIPAGWPMVCQHLVRGFPEFYLCLNFWYQ